MQSVLLLQYRLARVFLFIIGYYVTRLKYHVTHRIISVTRRPLSIFSVLYPGNA